MIFWEAEEFRGLLSGWPVDRARDWVTRVKEPMEKKERSRLEGCGRRDRPYGDERWRLRRVWRFGLEHTVRPI